MEKITYCEEIGWAVFSGEEQMTRALFSQSKIGENFARPYYKSAKSHALSSLKRHKLLWPDKEFRIAHAKTRH